MKKTLLFATLALTMTALMTACNSNNFKQSENGLLYRFETQNTEGAQPQPGDVLVGELILTMDGDTLFTNAGNPDRIFQVAEAPMFKGDIVEGLQMMHVGDRAAFKIPADSIANFVMESQMPAQYKKGAQRERARHAGQVYRRQQHHRKAHQERLVHHREQERQRPQGCRW